MAKLFATQHPSSICRSLLFTVFLEFAIVSKCTSNQEICITSSRRNISYFKVDTNETTWFLAWQACVDRKSILPVICNQHEQFALTSYLNANIGSSEAWTSGKKINFNKWTWIDGQRFNNKGMILSQDVSYTHIAFEGSGNYKAQSPQHKSYYLCQYSGSSCNSEIVINMTNGCVRPSDDDQTWYDARNRCLTNGGDLAKLKDADLVTLIGSKNLNAGHSYWIGLRKNTWHWIWQGIAVLSDDSVEDVKYSNWLNDPYSSSGECISIDSRDGGWNSVRCTDKKKVVCQTSSDETTSSTSSTMATSRPANASKSSSTTSTPSISSRSSSRPSISSRSSSKTSTMSITLLSTTTNAMSSMSEGATQSTTDWRVLLYSGVGAGIAIMIICIIVIVLALRCRRKPQKDINGSNVKNNSEQNRLDLSPNKPATSSTNAPAYAPVAGADDTQGVYAEISLATLNQMEDGAKAQQPGIIYAALEFQKEPTYLEPDKKRVNTTDAAKVGPMGDIIYAMPESKGHAATSPGNESASHPIKVTPQGDVYALPVKNSKSPTANPSHGGIYANL